MSFCCTTAATSPAASRSSSAATAGSRRTGGSCTLSLCRTPRYAASPAHDPVSEYAPRAALAPVGNERNPCSPPRLTAARPGLDPRHDRPAQEGQRKLHHNLWQKPAPAASPARRWRRPDTGSPQRVAQLDRRRGVDREDLERLPCLLGRSRVPTCFSKSRWMTAVVPQVKVARETCPTCLRYFARDEPGSWMQASSGPPCRTRFVCQPLRSSLMVMGSPLQGQSPPEPRRRMKVAQSWQRCSPSNLVSRSGHS